MKYNFDKAVIRQGTNCVKHDINKDVFGREDLLPMWVADMDFCTPPFIIEALKKRLEHEILGYTIRQPEYFESIVQWCRKRYGWEINKDWIVFSPGIVPAVNICTLVYTEPGDKIIVQPPVYFPFFGAIKDHGRKILFNRLIEKDGYYSIDFDDLRAKARLGAKMLILSNPHNPVGRVWKENELREIANICIENNVLIISDEIHSDLVLPGFNHIPMASLSDNIASNTLSCLAPSKTFNLAGLATSSMIISDSHLRELFQKKIDSLHISGGNIFGTEASIAAYREGEKWLDELMAYLKNNIDYLINRLNNSSLPIKALRPEATYMVWLDCRAMGLSGEELSKFFVEKAGLGLNEGSMFGPGGEGYMRINLACPLATVKKAIDMLEDAIKNKL